MQKSKKRKHWQNTSFQSCTRTFETNKTHRVGVWKLRMWDHYEHKHSCCNNWLWAQRTRLFCDCLQAACSKTIGNFAACEGRFGTYILGIRVLLLVRIYVCTCISYISHTYVPAIVWQCKLHVQRNELQSTAGTHACFGNAISVSSSSSIFQLHSSSCCLRALSSQLWQLATQSGASCGSQSVGKPLVN